MRLKFGSLALHPGTTGTYYYTQFFNYYGIEADYEPFKVENLFESLEKLTGERYAGFNVSMPFKYDVLDLLDFRSPDVVNFDSCNTVKVCDGELRGFNTDIGGVQKVMSNIGEDDHVVVLGNGAMGKMFDKILRSQNLSHSVVSQSLGNWESRHQNCDILINCTSLGTAIDKSPVNFLSGTRTVFDLTFNGQKLKEKCADIDYRSGIYFYKEVFAAQFNIHTGVFPDPDYFDFLTSSRMT